MGTYQMRGTIPSSTTADALRQWINELGDREVARQLGQSRATVARIAARLPVNESILFTAEARIPQLQNPEAPARLVEIA